MWYIYVVCGVRTLTATSPIYILYLYIYICIPPPPPPVFHQTCRVILHVLVHVYDVYIYIYKCKTKWNSCIYGVLSLLFVQIQDSNKNIYTIYDVSNQIPMPP